MGTRLWIRRLLRRVLSEEALAATSCGIWFIFVVTWRVACRCFTRCVHLLIAKEGRRELNAATNKENGEGLGNQT